MLKALNRPALAALSAALLTTLPAHADDADLQQLRAQINELRQQYEARLKALEDKLTETQQAQQRPPATTDMAAAPAPAPAVSSDTRKGNSAFNPAIGMILTGTYANLSKDPETWGMSGFVPPAGEVGPGKRSFSLGESEITVSANIDSLAFGSLTFALSPEETVEVEEGYVQTTALPAGLTLKAGRFYAGLGYLNEHHAHTWDFVDAPLTHQAFFGGQFKQDGVQAKWLLPTDQFIELSAELGRGANFPGSDRNRNDAGAIALSAHTGGDVGDSHTWRLGASWLQTKADARSWDMSDVNGDSVTNAFTGKSKLWIVDGVWKWAPHGNAKRTNFTLQGEYFRRTETGDVSYALSDNTLPAPAIDTGAYRSAQSGWYLQGVYQFMPQWRVGLRHDRLDSGSVQYGALRNVLANADYNPQRSSLMLDWSPSEFQRWRIQLSQDQARQGVKDTQLFLQYQMSLGAHGAHTF